MLLAKAKDPAFWAKVRTSEAYKPLIDELFAIWEKDCTGDIPACKYSEYIVYSVTGSRSEYEDSYFIRRRAMNASAILALIYPDEEKYLNKLCDVIWAILDEYNWVLPAHIHNFKDNVVAYLDLFAAETGFALSEIEYLLEDCLPQLIRSRITVEIDRRIIAAYEDQNYFWEKRTNNWSAVCVGCVGITYIYKHPERFESIRPRMEETLRCFLAGFPEDGICLEGFAYWHYGFGFFTFLADMVQQFTDGKINYFDHPKIREIVKYPQRMYLDGGTTVSFSDSGMSGRWHLGILHYLKKMFPDEVQIPPREYSYTNDECGRWGKHLRAFLWLDETLESASETPEFTDYAAASQWLIKKTKNYSIAVKGGHNAEPHNHNDVGSFIVTKNGQQVLCDPGAGKYCRQYFKGDRYTFFKTCSRGHSVPIIGGQYQKPGRAHEGISTFTDGIFTVEFCRAYEIASLTNLTRQFAFAEDAVIVSDTFAFEGEILPVVERFVSRLPAEITEAGVKTGGLTLIADDDVSITETEGFWCIDYSLKEGQTEFTLKVLA